ncbi:hypothetical protein CLCR_00345 [Cladophialophora carrionii]|uniref:Amino acid transporter transmembrane domain-containing protein n=1 Tax=Cladophialophora carrionii TaxID=86049 RepID=A0A1C1D0P5_9EURO|nr:hypothetical protein CLCR_00345 [Cladophialophora carrionii]
MVSRGCVFGLGAITFILASAIPIFNFLIAMVGSIAYAPIALIFPAWLWLYDHRDWWKRSFKHQVAYALHWLLLLIGALVTVGGTYAVITQIADAYATGLIGQSRPCTPFPVSGADTVARVCRLCFLVRRQLQLHLAG